MNKYLVTGGAGFIGSNIVRRLVKEGHFVRVLDNLSTGKLENLDSIRDSIEFIHGDLTSFEAAKESVTGIDYIFHEAAIPSVPRSIEDPISINESIVTATVNLFKAAADSNTVKRIVQAASAAAYGNEPTLPKREDMMPCPISPYGTAKLTQEFYGFSFAESFGLEILSLRYFNVFGPYQDPHSAYSGVISIFVSQLLEGRHPVIFGDGLTTRDFVYIDDVVEANLQAISCKWPGRHEVINIGRGESISLNELFEMLTRITNRKMNPAHKDERAGDIKHSLSDITKARQLLGYAPHVPVYEGLEKLVTWMKGSHE